MWLLFVKRKGNSLSLHYPAMLCAHECVCLVHTEQLGLDLGVKVTLLQAGVAQLCFLRCFHSSAEDGIKSIICRFIFDVCFSLPLS